MLVVRRQEKHKQSCFPGVSAVVLISVHASNSGCKMSTVCEELLENESLSTIYKGHLINHNSRVILFSKRVPLYCPPLDMLLHVSLAHPLN